MLPQVIQREADMLAAQQGQPVWACWAVLLYEFRMGREAECLVDLDKDSSVNEGKGKTTSDAQADQWPSRYQARTPLGRLSPDFYC